MTVELIEADDALFAWLKGEADAPAGVPPVCAGGLAPDVVIGIVADMAARVAPLHAGPSAWLVASGGEAVGLISYKAAPDADGRIDIGYGIAPAREGRGLATAAVAALGELAREQGVPGLTAETSIDNRASQLVLERNGFARTGEREDPEDGALICWALDLAEGNGK